MLCNETLNRSIRIFILDISPFQRKKISTIFPVWPIRDSCASQRYNLVLSDHPTPMAGVKGRHEARKRVCHRARTLSSAPLRSSTTAFRDNSTSVPNRGASPSLVRVSGIDHTGPVQGRTERTRASTEAHEGPRVRSKVLSSAGAQWLAGAG